MNEPKADKISVVFIANCIDWERSCYRVEPLASIFVLVGYFGEEEEGDPERPNFGLSDDPRAICLVEFADLAVANTLKVGVAELLRRLGHEVQERFMGED